MGVITLALLAAHPGREFSVPTWVIVSAAAAMAAGTYAGGWRIIRTLGQRVAKLEPPQGFAAEATTATILWFTAHLGFPVSTTHTISSAVLGAGASTRLSAVRWGLAGNIVAAWLVTIPCAALVGAGVERVSAIPGGVVVSVAIGLGTYAGGWRIIRTLGQRIYSMEPPQGFAAQTAAGATIYFATKYGYPLSTTHVVSGAVMGAGATRRVSAVRWGIAGNIVAAWVLTLPAAAAVAALCYWPVQGIF